MNTPLTSPRGVKGNISRCHLVGKYEKGEGNKEGNRKKNVKI
jgi:hypothetical protein